MAEEFVLEPELADECESEPDTGLDNRMDTSNNDPSNDDMNNSPLIESAGSGSELSKCYLLDETMPSLVAYELCPYGSGSSEGDTSQDANTKFHCDVCQRSYVSDFNLQRHLATITHLQNKALFSTPPPPLLRCVLSPPQLQQHVGNIVLQEQDIDNAQAVQDVDGTGNLDKEPNSTNANTSEKQDNGDKDKVHNCQVCDRVYSSARSLERHLSTLLHQQNTTTAPVEKLKEPKMEAKARSHCEVCDHTYCGPRELKKHFKTLVHKNNVKAALSVDNDKVEMVNEGTEEVVRKRKLDTTAEVTEEVVNEVIEEVDEVIEEVVSGATEELVVQKMSVEDLEWFKCKYCPRLFLSKETAIEHCQTHLLEKEKESDEDLLKAESDENLVDDEVDQEAVVDKVYEDIEWFKCKFCTRIFMCKSTAVEHCQTHKEDSYEDESEDEESGGGESTRDADDEGSSCPEA